ncbi:MAG: cbb3-type cytochrome oxidase assembly protein CcoS [Sulfitobacter dubius]|uniref:cbb3-type cytochrome oxidase assembly protein CcoS n=1 Tax=Sulfitobacter dubius TaxID=218673 RepID=UPI0008DFC12C|nr:cbb3-type cytochrome oxidase assembly protein CcoS [Sulfitobacter dubius]SFG55001.1 cytochrome oxidase maturation protein, cbb3-type [Sulfitobacter dubius]
MNILIILIPVSVLLGAGGLAACLWTLRNGQYEDLEGDAARILLEDPLDPRGPDSKTPAAPE